EVIENLVAKTMPKGSYSEQWDARQLHEEALRLLALDLPVEEWFKEEGIDEEDVVQRVREASDRKMAEKEATLGAPVMRIAEKSLLLKFLYQIWKDHLLALDHLRQGIQFRAYAQRNPLDEYTREAFEMFEQMLDRLRETTTAVLSHVQVRAATPEELQMQRANPRATETRTDPVLAGAGATTIPAIGPRPTAQAPAGLPAGMQAAPTPAPAVAPRAASTSPAPAATAARAAAAAQQWGKVPRNSPCPCGSGKKFKHCHGKA